MKRLAALARRRRDQHNRAADRNAGNRRAADVDHGVEVGAPRRFPLLVGHPGNGHIVRRPDAVIDDENIEAAAERAQRFGDGLGGPGRRAEVPAHRRGDVRGGRWFAATVSHGDLRAGARQQQRRRAPDAPAPTGNERTFALEIDQRRLALQPIFDQVADHVFDREVQLLNARGVAGGNDQRRVGQLLEVPPALP